MNYPALTHQMQKGEFVGTLDNVFDGVRTGTEHDGVVATLEDRTERLESCPLDHLAHQGIVVLTDMDVHRQHSTDTHAIQKSMQKTSLTFVSQVDTQALCIGTIGRWP